MKRKILLSVSASLVLLTCIVAVFSATGISRIRGSFQPVATWTGGHPGSIIFDLGSSNSGYTAIRDQDGYLSGFFWLGNTGWATFNQTDGVIPLCRARVRCPADILQNPYQACPVYGCAWSQNAGWIVLSGSMIDPTNTGVYYNPTTALIEGWGWNKGLGWVPFYAKTENQAFGIDPMTSSGISMDGVSVQFVGKIAIIGNIAGTRIFELPNQNVGQVFSFTNHASIVNTIRKNLALMTRNIADSRLEDVNSNLDFVLTKSNDFVFDFGVTWPASKKSIIVVGHDVIIDTVNDIGLNDGKVRGLIALKDDNGNGGNIIISDKSKRIYAHIFAEGSLFSGIKTGTGLIDPYISHGAFNIPQNQLYIKGLIVSKNTISGARQVPIVCPVVTNNCDQATAELYDLNYFRAFDPLDLAQYSVPYSGSTLNTASLVIEYNNAILTDPPPGLFNTIQ